jgi:Membrane iron-sulfur containing protein FtrD-like
MWRSRHHVLGRRRKRVDALSRQSWRLWALIAGVLLAVWGTAAGFAFWTLRKASASDNLPAIVLQAGENFVYDLGHLQSGQTRFFTYPTSPSERSKLLVQRDSDGVIRTAFASCIACYAFRADHKLNRGEFMCGHCQHAMRLGDQNERLTPEKSCVAVPVPFSVENNKVVVRPDAIAAGLEIFSSSAKGAVQKDRNSKDSQSRP